MNRFRKGQIVRLLGNTDMRLIGKVGVVVCVLRATSTQGRKIRIRFGEGVDPLDIPDHQIERLRA